MPGSTFVQQVIHIFKVFYVTTLVTGQCNALHIFLYSAIYYLFHAAVMAQVYDLGTAALQYAAHDINRSIMPVKQRRCSNKTYFIGRLIGNTFHNAKLVNKINQN